MESRRAKKTYPVNSMEMNCDLGEAILDAFPEMRVDVHNPDVLLNVEVRKRFIFIPTSYRAWRNADRNKRQCHAAPLGRN